MSNSWDKRADWFMEDRELGGRKKDQGGFSQWQIRDQFTQMATQPLVLCGGYEPHFGARLPGFGFAIH